MTTSVLGFGDDRSSGADLCWDWVSAHQWPGWRLEIVTAEAPRDLRPVAEGDGQLHSWEPSAPRPASGLGFESTEHLTAAVDPRTALISKRWDLLAIGPRGDGLLKRLHLGSTADWLLRQPTSPLLIARHGSAVSQVLLATDGSPHAHRATECLASMPWLDGVKVSVLAVDDGHVDAESAAADAVDALSSTDAQAEVMIESGRPSQAISNACSELGADLVVMGARGASPLKWATIGSTTFAVSGSTEASLLVAHAVGDAN